ncbi:pullulanase [Virgibacillus kekensis]|uniref:pullulanase n=1 Tax=Virgibacillus kekensis TaxID=202261 RepID=A0ABV9DG40_9BACI
MALRKGTSLLLVFILMLSITLPFIPVKPVNAEETTDNRTIRLTYERDDGNYTGWDVWVWNTGVTDGSIAFTEFENGLATAYIEVSPTTEEIGFIIRKNNWEDREPAGQKIDRFIQVNHQEPITKVHVRQGEVDFHTVPEIPAPQIKDGDATFYYRDSLLYQNNRMGTLDKVELSVAGNSYEMTYDSLNERFEYTYQNFPYGTYEYSFNVTKDGTTEQVDDPYHSPSVIENLKVDINVSGNVTPSAIDYNQNAVLSLDIGNATDAEIRKIYADTSALGGPEQLEVDPKLKKVTLSVKHDVPAGIKEIPITVVDEFGTEHKGTATVEVKTRQVVGEGDFNWDEAVIYFLLTDRFFDGNSSNNDPYGLNYDTSHRGTYQGGDLQGITKKLDYLDELGINTIWISPIVENIKYDVRYNASEANPEEPYYGYHGYWGSNFEKLNPHFGSIEDLHRLIDEAAARGIKIMVDVVLNHAGYGLKEVDDLPETEQPAGYPTDEERAFYSNLVRQGTDVGTDEVTGELAGLPDFITEDPAVRQQIIDWQSSWIEKSRTDKGNAISYFRVDTVKHVEDTTLKAFKNSVTAVDPEFKMIGEAWGATQHEGYGMLESGEMDSLLDFEFKQIARDFVSGDLESANSRLENRNGSLSNTATMGQFLSSHDEDGFLYSAGGDEGKLMVAASLQMTAKGQPVIYYGEELGLTGKNNYPFYDNRYDMDWSLTENNPVLEHYQKTLDFREQFSEILAQGTRNELAGSNAEGYLLFERSHNGDSVYVGLNVSSEKKEVTLAVDSTETTVVDHYSGKTYSADNNQTVTITIPAMGEGGSVLLTTTNGTITGEGEVSEQPPAIPENTLRVHYEQSDNNFSGLGLWVWGDVETPSEQTGGWPDGATDFTESQMTDYGAYVDIELADDAETVGMLVNNANGDNLTSDISVDILSPDMNEIWLTENGEVSLYEPAGLGPNEIRIHYKRTDNTYEPWGLWTWGDVVAPSQNWPWGAHAFSDGQVGEYGAYVDINLTENAEKIGFLLVERKNGGSQTGDMSFSELGEHKQLFLLEGDETVYTNPYYVHKEGLEYGELVALDRMELTFSSTADFTEQQLAEGMVIKDNSGNAVKAENVTKDGDGKTVIVEGTFDIEKAPYLVTFMNQSEEVNKSWKLTDELYSYEGDDLGATLNKNKSATLKVWSPSADQVSVVLYDKKVQYEVVSDDITMVKGDRGVWQVTLDQKNTGIPNLTGYYYHYKIERDGETVLALDPYAKSMATWNVEDTDDIPVGKAAIVNPGKIGPTLRHADIKGFKEREDAIIYEAHVRDFTSDPSIDDELHSEFGTFSAFIEKLDYLEELGVTHIQLLPVMNYFNVNESDHERLLDYSSSDNNYNWGYDPQSYFSLTGMYSENPDDAAQRIKEFKFLIKEIHKRGMGVILDVVYNHTARVEIFENLEPNYYHFMDADLTPRVSFGGGRLGTTHAMTKKLLVDSITYWVDEFKVDGFRFDMMGDHDAASIQMAYDKAKELNPNILMIGEGWRTYAGDENGGDVMPADQDWMQHTNGVAVFSDEFRNELKSGFGSEGQPRFLTGGARNIQQIFDNVTANPHNFKADDPGDVVTYIAAHDNLTLHDVIAQSIKKDPKYHEKEIHKRIRIGNTMVLTSQGTAFLHAGQEYGRTKQFKHEDYKGPVNNPPEKSTYMTTADGTPFAYPYFTHDSYDSSDAVNMIEWEKITNEKKYPIQTQTRKYTQGLIELRRSTDAFTLGTRGKVNTYVSKVNAPEIGEQDLIIGYRAEAPEEEEAYYVFINADDNKRTLTLEDNLTHGKVIVDNDEAGVSEVTEPSGYTLTDSGITIDPLTAVIVKVK